MDFDSLIGPANQAVLFYESQLKATRLAVETWVLIAHRLNIVIKDVRRLISNLIWDAREESNYPVEPS